MVLPHKLHLIGISGAGMIGLAQCLIETGHQLSGSDLHRTDEVEALIARGVTFFNSHEAMNISHADLIVVSDAIPANNPELIEARLRDTPVIKRAECLDRLAQAKQSIFVAGSHGKSTTTSMITAVLQAAGTRPSYLIGAQVEALGTQRGHIQDGEYFVAEACEAFQNLGHLHPYVAVITNIDDDHLEHYGSQARLDLAFKNFAECTGEKRGTLVVNGDDEGVQRLLPDLQCPAVTFGFDPSNTFSAQAVSFDQSGSQFEVWVNGHVLGQIRLPIPGRHAVANAMACVATCFSLGFSLDQIARALAPFTGVARRWDDHGLIGGIRVVDDYAHHPTALKASIETARSLCRPGQKLVVAFQPQLFSRTQRLYNVFAEVLLGSDRALLLDIQAAGERNTGSISSKLIVDEIQAHGALACGVADAEELVDRISEWVNPGDFLLLAGAGNIRHAAAMLHQCLEKEALSRNRLSFADFSSLPQKEIAAQPTTALDMFEACARKNPDQPAVADAERRLSYSMLDHAADAVAIVLSQHGIAHGDVVGIALPSSIELIVCLLAVTKLGAVYLPLDQALPVERVAYMLKQAEARTLIARDGYKAPEGITALRLHDIQAGLNKPASDETILQPPQPDDRAYICFTSGSTGFPKGIAIKHASLFALARDMVKRFGITPVSNTAVNTSISFDVSLGEIWMALAGGACLCVTNAAKPLVGQSFAEFLKSRAITHLAITPSVLGSVPVWPLAHLKCIITIGETLPQELMDKWAGGRDFFNAYGPTEATVYATVARCAPGVPVTIGTAMEHVQACVLDENLRPAANGEIGELCLTGVGVADGYLGADPTGGAKFLTFKQPGQPDAWLYRTGDMARVESDGNLSFHGRRDNQIKINGHRIELEEIERTMSGLPGIKDVAVCIHENGAHKELVAFIVHEAGSAFNANLIRKQLLKWLPEYMAPAHIMPITALPLTPSGKKDRKSLLKTYSENIIRKTDYVKPRSDIEKVLAAIWHAALKREEPIGVYDDYAFIGGDSLGALLIIEETERQFSLEIPPGYLGRFTNVAAMAVQLSDLVAQQEGATRHGFRGSHLYRQLRNLSAGWQGARVNSQSIVFSSGNPNPAYELFLCMQDAEEVKSIAAHIGDDFRVHGMRSGHLVMTYAQSNVEALAAHYLEEMDEINPTGQLVLAGICQGGAIVRAMANRLKEQGRLHTPLILIEQARLIPYAHDVAFFYSEDGYLNPFERFENKLERFDQIYGQNYTVDIMPGPHGLFHTEPYVQRFVEQLRERLMIDRSDQKRAAG